MSSVKNISSTSAIVALPTPQFTSPHAESESPELKIHAFFEAISNHSPDAKKLFLDLARYNSIPMCHNSGLSVIGFLMTRCKDNLEFVAIIIKLFIQFPQHIHVSLSEMYMNFDSSTDILAGNNISNYRKVPLWLMLGDNLLRLAPYLSLTKAGTISHIDYLVYIFTMPQTETEQNIRQLLCLFDWGVEITTLQPLYKYLNSINPHVFSLMMKMCPNFTEIVVYTQWKDEQSCLLFEEPDNALPLVLFFTKLMSNPFINNQLLKTFVENIMEYKDKVSLSTKFTIYVEIEKRDPSLFIELFMNSGVYRDYITLTFLEDFALNLPLFHDVLFLLLKYCHKMEHLDTPLDCSISLLPNQKELVITIIAILIYLSNKNYYYVDESGISFLHSLVVNFSVINPVVMKYFILELSKKDKPKETKVYDKTLTVRMFTILVANYPFLNYQDPLMRHTSLHIACQMQNLDMFKLLLSVGLNISCKDNEGSTPLDIAKQFDEDISAEYISLVLSSITQIDSGLNIETRTEYIDEYIKHMEAPTKDQLLQRIKEIDYSKGGPVDTAWKSKFTDSTMESGGM